jgi:predicted ferric reductase
MPHMPLLIAILCAIVAAAWGWHLSETPLPAGVHPLWFARQQLLFLSGFLAIAMMSLAMGLATRPRWLERPLGGMDQVYRTHKWAGILGITLGALHWLTDQAGGLLKATIGRAGRMPKPFIEGWLGELRDPAKEMGEWAIYLALIMLAITLWKRFPYRSWRFLHRAMPVLYLMVACHALLLAPPAYWQGPAGGLLTLLIMIGLYGAVCSLSGRIGLAMRHVGNITHVEHPSHDITTVTCQLANSWSGHRPGQFAFVTFDMHEGSHPFTIASADRGDQVVQFQIKSLGDYTAQLGHRLRPGQPIRLEGPYGCFDLSRCDSQTRQIWVAGGIGITPFLSWLETLAARPRAEPQRVDLHYCTRNQASDPFIERIAALCNAQSGVTLHIHDAQQGKLLDARLLDELQRSEIWFCGPASLAHHLRSGLHALGQRVRFHQEIFEMR